MTKLYSGVYATPFHSRTAVHNKCNAWVRRGTFTVPRHFGNVEREVLAARFSAIVADLSAMGRLRVSGEGAMRLLTSALNSDIETIKTGEAREVYWTNDGGGVRGVGVAARYGEANFLLEAIDTDRDWFATAAPRFEAKLRDETTEKGLLLLAGPYARQILEAAGLEGAAKLGPFAHIICSWNGISISVAHRPALGGYEISCSRDDGLIVFDRISEAGRPFALTLIGQEALELLQLEAGIPIIGLDYSPARSPNGGDPSPASIGCATNGATGVALAGVEWDGREAASFAPLLRLGQKIGHTLRSAYSPAGCRMIALAQVPADQAQRGNELQLRIGGDKSDDLVSVRVRPLPFLSL
jgi:glycine cleavage system aminomethyltransferase T